jgi:hypothetical protein
MLDVIPVGFGAGLGKRLRSLPGDFGIWEAGVEGEMG